MSAIIVVSVEGVLTAPGQSLPTASVSLPGLQLVRAVSESWQVGYVAETGTETAMEWLRAAGAPTWCWVASANMENRAETILRQLSQRQDRARFVIASNEAGFDTLLSAGIAVVCLQHEPGFALGDWRERSSWGGDDDETLVRRLRGSDPQEVPPGSGS